MQFVFDGRAAESPLVEAVWRTESEGFSGSFISAAATNWEMVVTRQTGGMTLSVRGPETLARPSPVPHDAEFLGIIFKVGTYLSNLSAPELVNQQIHLPEAGGRNTFWLHGSAWQFPTFENVDSFIARLEREGLLQHNPLVDAVLKRQPQDVSLRTVRRHFLQTTGLTPKDIQQIERARRAAALLKQGNPILDTVYQTGFFDQAHMTKSLKYFIGQTPAQLLHPDDPELFISAL